MDGVPSEDALQELSKEQLIAIVRRMREEELHQHAQHDSQAHAPGGGGSSASTPCPLPRATPMSTRSSTIRAHNTTTSTVSRLLDTTTSSNLIHNIDDAGLVASYPTSPMEIVANPSPTGEGPLPHTALLSSGSGSQCFGSDFSSSSYPSVRSYPPADSVSGCAGTHRGSIPAAAATEMQLPSRLLHHSTVAEAKAKTLNNIATARRQSTAEPSPTSTSQSSEVMSGPTRGSLAAPPPEDSVENSASAAIIPLIVSNGSLSRTGRSASPILSISKRSSEAVVEGDGSAAAHYSSPLISCVTGTVREDDDQSPALISLHENPSCTSTSFEPLASTYNGRRLADRSCAPSSIAHLHNTTNNINGFEMYTTPSVFMSEPPGDSVTSLHGEPVTCHTKKLVRCKVSKTGKRYINHYHVLKEVGRGASGKVLLAYDDKDRRLVAIKVVRRADTKRRIGGPSIAQKQYAGFLREVELLKKLRHSNIVSVFEVIDDPSADSVYLVMQYVDQGSIAQIELKEGSEYVCEPIHPLDLTAKAGKILAALEYLHRHNVVHRDIKPDNILVSRDGDVYLADFGVAETFDAGFRRRMEKMMEQSITYSSYMAVAGEHTGGPLVLGTKGTMLFIAPELWSGQQSYGKPVDVWALGVTLYTLLTGRLPFRNLDEIANPDLPLIPTEYGAGWSQLLRGMLDRNPQTRLTAKDARAIVKLIQERNLIAAGPVNTVRILRLQREVVASARRPEVLQMLQGNYGPLQGRVEELEHSPKGSPRSPPSAVAWSPHNSITPPPPLPTRNPRLSVPAPPQPHTGPAPAPFSRRSTAIRGRRAVPEWGMDSPRASFSSDSPQHLAGTTGSVSDQLGNSPEFVGSVPLFAIPPLDETSPGRHAVEHGDTPASSATAASVGESSPLSNNSLSTGLLSRTHLDGTTRKPLLTASPPAETPQLVSSSVVSSVTGNPLAGLERGLDDLDASTSTAEGKPISPVVQLSPRLRHFPVHFAPPLPPPPPSSIHPPSTAPSSMTALGRATREILLQRTSRRRPARGRQC